MSDNEEIMRCERCGVEVFKRTIIPSFAPTSYALCKICLHDLFGDDNK